MLPPLMLPRASSTSETAPDCAELESQVASAVLPTCAAIEKLLLTCTAWLPLLGKLPLARLNHWASGRSLRSQSATISALRQRQGHTQAPPCSVLAQDEVAPGVSPTHPPATK